MLLVINVVLTLCTSGLLQTTSALSTTPTTTLTTATNTTGTSTSTTIHTTPTMPQSRLVRKLYLHFASITNWLNKVKLAEANNTLKTNQISHNKQTNKDQDGLKLDQPSLIKNVKSSIDNPSKLCDLTDHKSTFNILLHNITKLMSVNLELKAQLEHIQNDNLELKTNLTLENVAIKSDIRGLESTLQKTLTNLEDLIKAMAACPDGWNEFERRCYLFHKCDTVECSPQSGRKHCNRLGGELTSVQSKAHQDFLHASLPRTDIYIGGNFADGEWKWPDGTLMNAGYTNWRGRREPYLALSKDTTCMYIEGSTKYWRTIYCENEYNDSYVCERNK